MKDFSKRFFYFPQASEYHYCTVHVTGKVPKQGDEKGIIVPCLLLFKGQLGECTEVLNVELKKHIEMYMIIC